MDHSARNIGAWQPGSIMAIGKARHPPPCPDASEYISTEKSKAKPCISATTHDGSLKRANVQGLRPPPTARQRSQEAAHQHHNRQRWRLWGLARFEGFVKVWLDQQATTHAMYDFQYQNSPTAQSLRVDLLGRPFSGALVMSMQPL